MNVLQTNTAGWVILAMLLPKLSNALPMIQQSPVLLANVPVVPQRVNVLQTHTAGRINLAMTVPNPPPLAALPMIQQSPVLLASVPIVPLQMNVLQTNTAGRIIRAMLQHIVAMMQQQSVQISVPELVKRTMLSISLPHVPLRLLEHVRPLAVPLLPSKSRLS